MTAASNRQSMPTITLFVDEYRKSFPDLKVTYASENGKELGRKGGEGVVPVIKRKA